MIFFATIVLPVFLQKFVQTSLALMRIRLYSSTSVMPLIWKKCHTNSKYRLTSPYTCREVNTTINLKSEIQRHREGNLLVQSGYLRKRPFLPETMLALWYSSEKKSVFNIPSLVQHLNISVVLPRFFSQTWEIVFTYVHDFHQEGTT